MVITSIQQAKKNLDRVNVFLDEKFWISLDKNQVIEFGLHKGMEINEEDPKYSLLEDASKQGKLLNRIIKYISIRPRSIKEVRDHLILKIQTNDTEVSNLITKLEQMGYLNDEKFSIWFVENRKNFGFHGDNKIKMELFKKGIKNDVIKKVLNKFKDEDAEIEKIKMLAKKVEKSIKAKDEYDKKNKLMRRLIGRGFEYDLVKKALNK